MVDLIEDEDEDQDGNTSNHLGLSPKQEATYRQMLRDIAARSDAASRYIQAQNVEIDHLVVGLISAGTPVEFVARSVAHLGPPDGDVAFLRSRIRNAFSLYARDLPAWEGQGEAWPLPDDLGYTLGEDEKRALLGEVRDVRELTTIARQLLDAFQNLDSVMPVEFVASVLTPAGVPLGLDVGKVRRLVEEQARNLDPRHGQVDEDEVRELARMLAVGAKLAAEGRAGKPAGDLVAGMVDALAEAVRPFKVARERLEAVVRAAAEAVGLELKGKAKGEKPKGGKSYTDRRSEELRDTYGDWEDE